MASEYLHEWGKDLLTRGPAPPEALLGMTLLVKVGFVVAIQSS